jgi:NAD(P)-dependent dehydrogenase (short-subunit alcohol dehydrogenase family)
MSGKASDLCQGAPMKRALVVGAAGDVGQGIVSELLAGGYQVIAAGRTESSLHVLAQRLDAQLSIVVGSLEDEESTRKLLEQAKTGGELDVVVVSVNGPRSLKPILEQTVDQLVTTFRSDVLTHFNAAKTFIPKISAGGCFISIGGGMADFVAPGYSHLSMAQAALRMMLRYFAKEFRGSSVRIHELLIASMVNGEKRRQEAEPSWVTDADIGRHVLAVLEQPENFRDPVLKLFSREQVGQPEPKATDVRRSVA